MDTSHGPDSEEDRKGAVFSQLATGNDPSVSKWQKNNIMLQNRYILTSPTPAVGQIPASRNDAAACVGSSDVESPKFIGNLDAHYTTSLLPLVYQRTAAAVFHGAYLAGNTIQSNGRRVSFFSFGFALLFAPFGPGGAVTTVRWMTEEMMLAEWLVSDSGSGEVEDMVRQRKLCTSNSGQCDTKQNKLSMNTDKLKGLLHAHSIVISSTQLAACKRVNLQLKSKFNDDNVELILIDAASSATLRMIAA
ncbi:hypothetical protein C8R47DRAFT_1196456 [Mycena vitilis]|nr:hypothetical protein C8R47DRAFT_1196456 [Mycena vitilis]